MPAVVAIAVEFVGDPDFAIFAAFGALAGLLFVDFSGPMHVRLSAQTGLVSVGAVLVCLGTLASQAIWAAAVATFIIVFSLLFVSVASSVLADATTALLVSFLLPVTMPGSVSSIPDRLGGWLLGGAASLIAIAVLWPAPVREPLRLSAAQACGLLARRLRAEVECVRRDFEPQSRADLDVLTEDAVAAVTALRLSFFSTSYRPTGLGTAARALIRVIDQVVWLGEILERAPLEFQPRSAVTAVCSVKLESAALLDRGAALLESTAGDPSELGARVRALERTGEAMERTVMSLLPTHLTEAYPRGVPNGAVPEFLRSLQPSFRAQQMVCAISAISMNIEIAVTAHQRSWWRHLLGCRAEGVESPLSSARERVSAQTEPHSVWLHNSLRGATALCLAVLVAESTGVQHSFWVVFGALTVLCSSVLNTGQSALRGLLGNAIGFLISGGLIIALGMYPIACWLLLPPAVALAAMAPEAVSFTVGQAGFTTALLTLYDIVDPEGWEIGLVRLENVAIGCAVSLVAGVLFWPRGSGSALGSALAEALSDSAHYLRSAIECGLTRCDARVPTAPLPGDDRHRAVSAARRLDEAFRGFLAERGTKHASLAGVTTLVDAGVILRLTADAVLHLWRDEDPAPEGDRTAERAEILQESVLLVDWYEKTARALEGMGTVPDQLESRLLTCRLGQAVRREFIEADVRGTATAVRMIWMADHIDAVRRLQAAILEPARAASQQCLPRSWLGGHRTSAAGG
ncbi:FUSC family protein [Streptomyces sp. NPDC008222]|uniref:FUSC family protein n=1 Tax=Streptomyces sp. NPDC008222 TaxID=3364820 RepID=UPI0036E14BE0